MTLPNLITIARLVCVPALIVMIGQGRWMAAFVLFVAAGLSDAVDGFIAKRFDMRSELGAYIDPLADKALLVSVYVALALVAALPVWLAVMVVSRDAMIVSAIIVSWLMERPVRIRPLWISKANTAAQIALAALVLGARALGVEAEAALAPATALTAALTIASAGAYLALWMRHMTG